MPHEYPDQSYFPACRVRLIIRFDDFGEVDKAEAGTVFIPPHLRKGTKTGPAPLTFSKDSNGALVLKSKSGSQPGGPQKQTGSNDNRTTTLEGIIPVNCTIHRNGIRTPTTASVELRYADLPLDPRAIRACAIEILFGCVSEDEFEKGVMGQVRDDTRGAEGGGLGLNVVPETFLDDQGNQRSNLRFQGWVDEWEDEWPEGDEQPIVRLECTDNTRLITEQNAPPQLEVAVDKPIDEAIADYLSNFPQFDGLEVFYEPQDLDRPMLKDALSTTAIKNKGGTHPSGGHGSNNEKHSVWDHLTDVAGRVGHIIRVKGVRVIIQRARTLYGAKFTSRQDDPFTGRILPSGRTVLNRLMIYGRNVLGLSLKRKFTRYAPFNVEVRCYSGKQKKTLIARFPLPGDRVKRLVPGDSKEEKWEVFRFQGIEDEKTLRIIAQGIYENIGRNELEGKLSTKNLASYGGGNLDPDLLDLEPGDNIDLEFARELEELSTTGSIEEQITNKAASFLQSLGYSADFAAAYQKAVSNIGLVTTFRVKAWVLDWSIDEGPGLSIEIVNYVEVRGDKSLDSSEEAPAETGNSPGPVKVTVDDNS